jgi:hypothetical protein
MNIQQIIQQKKNNEIYNDHLTTHHFDTLLKAYYNIYECNIITTFKHILQHVLISQHNNGYHGFENDYHNYTSTTNIRKKIKIALIIISKLSLQREYNTQYYLHSKFMEPLIHYIYEHDDHILFSKIHKIYHTRNIINNKTTKNYKMDTYYINMLNDLMIYVNNNINTKLKHEERNIMIHSILSYY